MSNVDAAAALDKARKRHTDGDDVGALKMAEKSQRICASDGAQQLLDHIRKFGDASEMAATARRIIEAADLYAVLQLAYDATPDDVKKAYHRTSKIVHPDKNKSRQSEDAFKRVGEAFSTLSDPKRKQVYDLGLKATCNHCAGVTARGAMDAHLRACPRRPTTCAWAAAGCVWSGVPAEQAAHQAMCPIGFAVFQFQQMAQQVAAQNYLLQAQFQAQFQVAALQVGRELGRVRELAPTDAQAGGRRQRQCVHGVALARTIVHGVAIRVQKVADSTPPDTTQPDPTPLDPEWLTEMFNELDEGNKVKEGGGRRLAQEPPAWAQGSFDVFV